MLGFVAKLRRGLRKPPRVIFDRLILILRTQTERFRLPRRNNLSEKALLQELEASSLEDLWNRLTCRQFPAWFGPFDVYELDSICGAGKFDALLARANAALEHRVDLLGSGPTNLGVKIDWHTDFKTGFSWPEKYFADIEYNNLERSSDVKCPGNYLGSSGSYLRAKLFS